MPFSLYKRLFLDKLIPTDISLQMADKSTAVPIGICEDVPVEVANCLILTNFVVLDMPEDGSMSIILRRPFLNTAGAIIDCNKGKFTFNVNDNIFHILCIRRQFNSISQRNLEKRRFHPFTKLIVTLFFNSFERLAWKGH